MTRANRAGSWSSTTSRRSSTRSPPRCATRASWCAGTGRGAVSAVVEFEPDLVVLDWMLPDLAGIDVGRRLRERGFKTAILFLTAKDGVADKVEALRAGGDDYVTKPFSLAEVVARVEAILRRTESRAQAEMLRFADVTLDEN